MIQKKLKEYSTRKQIINLIYLDSMINQIKSKKLETSFKTKKNSKIRMLELIFYEYNFKD